MAENCEEKLAGAFIKKCGHKPKQGVAKKWYINWEDIDREATQLANKRTKITALVLKEGAVIYPAIGNKVSRANHALAVRDFDNAYIHTDSYIVTYRGEEELERIQELVDGGRVVTINEKIDGGLAGEIKYAVLGFESGMLITEDTWNTAENGGSTTLTVATMEGEEEATGAKLFLLGDGVAATAAWITANQYVEPEGP